MAGAIASLLLFLVPCVFSIGGNDLRQPEIRQSVNGFLQTTLVVDVFHYNEDTPIQFWTRAYEGDLPGPTLRFKPGDVLNITIVNKLLPDIDGDLNTFHSANTTNLHTHGLHVSPEGLADDIFKAVNPGEMLLYSYQIPTNHPWGGTWWYHPHWHGSSTLQQSGGLSGAIIIDPVDPKQTPPEIAAMKEVVMVLQHLCFEHDEDDWNPYDDHLVVSEYGYDNLAINASFVFPNASQSFYVVNGQYQPVVRMVPGEWQLWKVINAGHAINVIFQVPGCDMYTISVDGIWLTAPLQDSYPLFVPAGHIDIAVRCSAAGTYNVTSANNAPYSGDFEQQTKVYDGVLATVVVSGDPVVMNLPTSLPPLPDYLKDLTNITNLDTSYTMLFHAEPGPVPLGTYPNTYYINGEAYTGDPEHYQTTMTVGKPQQWIINDQAGGVNHPFHMHTNQFQIIQLGNDPTYSTLGIVPGQWRDTIPTMDGINILIRFVPDTWTGTIVLHCHMTPHIDLGMMATVAVTDGTTPITLHANSTRGHHKKTKN